MPIDGPVDQARTAELACTMRKNWLRSVRTVGLIGVFSTALVVMGGSAVYSKVPHEWRYERPAIAKRLADIWDANSQYSEQQRWKVIAERLRASDPLADAKRDSALKVRGFLALRNTAWPSGHFVPGIVCKQEDKLYNHIVYTLAHGDYLTSYIVEALTAYRGYAISYNHYVMLVDGLQPEACEVSAE